MPERQKSVVLVVDDDAAIRQYITTVLEPERYDCLSASSATEALIISRNRAERIDLLLCGYRLSDGNGVEVAKKIRAGRCRIAVLIMSGTPTDGEAAKASGCAFLAKPFLPAELIREVRSLLRLSFSVTVHRHSL